MMIFLFSGQVMTGRLVKRYKRFFMDVRLNDGSIVCAHTPNTGSMKGLLQENSEVILSYEPSASRKLHYTVQAIDDGSTYVGCNTYLPNKIIEQAIISHEIDCLKGYKSIRREVRYGVENKSRIDLLLENHDADKANCFIEIKSVTLKENKLALFPDAVSLRGQKHLTELIYQTKKGFRAVMLYLIQRDDCEGFAAASHIDANYAKLLKEAIEAGVEIICQPVKITKKGIILLKKQLPVVDP